MTKPPLMSQPTTPPPVTQPDRTPVVETRVKDDVREKEDIRAAGTVKPITNIMPVEHVEPVDSVGSDGDVEVGENSGLAGGAGSVGDVQLSENSRLSGDVEVGENSGLTGDAESVGDVEARANSGLAGDVEVGENSRPNENIGLGESVAAAENAALDNHHPHLQKRLDAFIENGFDNPQQVMAIIRHARFGASIAGELSERYAGLDCDAKDRVKFAAIDIINSYAEYFEAQRSNGITLDFHDAVQSLEADIGHICNFDGNTPQHSARQGIENHLLALYEAQEATPTGKELATCSAGEHQHDGCQPQRRSDTLSMGAIAGAAVGLGATAEAVKHWRDRTRSPEAPHPTKAQTPKSANKAKVFATVAAVALGATAVAIGIQRGGLHTDKLGAGKLGQLLGKLGQNSHCR